MEYFAACDTDVMWISSKKINQDSVWKDYRVTMGRTAIILLWGGMGKLSRKELACPEVIHNLANWFDSQFPFELPEFDWYADTHNVISRLSRLNEKFMNCGRCEWMQLGTKETNIIVSQGKTGRPWKDSELYDTQTASSMYSRKKSCSRSSRRHGTHNLVVWEHFETEKLSLFKISFSMLIELAIYLWKPWYFGRLFFG